MKVLRVAASPVEKQADRAAEFVVEVYLTRFRKQLVFVPMRPEFTRLAEEIEHRVRERIRTRPEGKTFTVSDATSASPHARRFIDWRNHREILDGICGDARLWDESAVGYYIWPTRSEIVNR